MSGYNSAGSKEDDDQPRGVGHEEMSKYQDAEADNKDEQ